MCRRSGESHLRERFECAWVQSRDLHSPYVWETLRACLQGGGQGIHRDVDNKWDNQRVEKDLFRAHPQCWGETRIKGGDSKYLSVDCNSIPDNDSGQWDRPGGNESPYKARRVSNHMAWNSGPNSSAHMNFPPSICAREPINNFWQC